MIIALQTLIFFRESLLGALDRLLRPYYKRFSLVFSRSKLVSEDDESEEQVFSVYDDERGVVFYPPVYTQRYAAVSDCLMDERWCGKLEKVVDLGYHDMSFIKYLKEVPGVRCILGVDIESIPLRCSSNLFGCEEYAPKRENPLQVILFQGNAADPDYRLIGSDAVIAIEMIEHMLPHDLDRLVHTIFGFIKPCIVIFTTPNADFNVLFKALEWNGLRRLDHFFEWTREQFNDWCSNIVLRYPQYLVTCRGIGPGPPDTHHLGCCSQMALFISKDYHKQQDLNLNSLALVANAPNPDNLSYIISSSDIVDSYAQNSLVPNIIQSYTELLFSEKQSGMTIVITSPSFSIDTLEYQDKTSQCNLDSENGKNFLMFDNEQMCFDIVMPRRKVYNKVYEIEDVNSRLNCTTLQVNKFSKTTQNLMAKNKIDSLVHTREVVDEIRHLTKMLNFNKDSLNQDVKPYVWANINWGDNAPYWNQYYKIVREYNYPFETKSEECRILDLISDEINKLIDMQYDEEFCVDDNKLEIPLQHLMGVVQHITEDVDRVKDLLEWNGYEIVDDVVIHSRLVIDSASVVSHEEDWQDNEASDWDTTDFHSTSISDGSTIAPDYHGRCLRRALDNKLRKLRSMLTADEDITTELDRVVCRLMKLALRTSRGRQNPPPTRWMQYKLLDLLTLTEKTIDRRKRHFIDTYSLKAIHYDVEDKSDKNIVLKKMRGDDTVNKIVDRYQDLVQPTVLNKELDDLPRLDYVHPHMELKDDSSVASTELLKEYDYVNRQSPGFIDPELILNENAYESDLIDQEEIKYDRVRSWVEEDNMEVVPYPNHSINFDNSSGDTDHSTGFVARGNCNRTYKRFKSDSTHDNDLSMYKTCKRKFTNDKRTVNHGENNKKKMKFNKIKIDSKKETHKKPNCSNYLRNSKNFDQPKRQKGRSTPSNPIPKSLIELCHPELSGDKYDDDYQTPLIVEGNQTNENNSGVNNVSATEESYLIAIVMEDMEETVALRRTIGTDTDSEPIQIEYETLIRCISHETSYKFREEHEPSTENVESQTIFLTDINEPSTSKGIRHISMDVQCGSDNIVQTYSMLSATTSYTKLSKLTEIGVKIGDLLTDVKAKSTEFGTSTDDIHQTIGPNTKSIGIRIRNSDQILTQEVKDAETVSPVLQNLVSNETKLLKAVFSNLKIEDSCSEFCSSNGSLLKSPPHYIDSNDPNKVQINLCLSREIPVSHKLSSTKYVKPMLCSGGVHIHSYKDKTLSEDVVYQGEWQRYRPKILIKKRSLSSLVLNRVTHPLLKRNDAIKKKIQIMSCNNKEINYEIQKHIQSRNNAKPIMNKPRAITKTFKNEKIVNINKTPKLPTIKKIASKHTVRAFTSKSNYTSRNPLVLSSIGVKKDTNLQQQRPLLKKYIPKYLRKSEIKLCTSITKNLTETLDMVGTRKKVNKKKMQIDVPLSLKPETKEIKSDLLKFHQVPSERMNYLIFRNEIDSKNSASNEESVKPEEKITNQNNSNNGSHSPQSQNSSTCSSPNSIATIRFVSKKPKSVSARKNTASSLKSYIDDSGSETPTPSRMKKFTKRGNSCKSTKNSDNNNFDNKENLSEKNNRNSKKGNKIDKNVFKGSQKNVFIAQLNTENQSLQSTLTSLPKYKPQYSNFTFSSENNVDIINNTSESPSDSNKRFLKCENIMDVDNNNNKNLENISTNEKAGLLLEPLLQRPNQEIKVTKNTVESNLGCSIESNSDAIGNYKNKNLENSSSNEKAGLLIEPLLKISNQEIKETKITVESNLGCNIESNNDAIDNYKNKNLENSSTNEKAGLLIEPLLKISNQEIKETKNIVESNLGCNIECNNDAIDNYKNKNLENSSTNEKAGLLIEPLLKISNQEIKETKNTVKSNLGCVKEFNSDAIDNYNDIRNGMKQLLEETFNFFEIPCQNHANTESDTSLSRKDIHPDDQNSSTASFRTIPTSNNKVNSTLDNAAENDLNDSFNTTLGDISLLSLTDTNVTVTDLDLLSFKSITSETKLSESYLDGCDFSGLTPKINSVLEIFEKKDEPLTQIPGGTLAIQAFSGFSVNAEPFVGDQIDHINYVDSETGSLAFEIARQATSEELFVSGRSSSSYESCVIDEDAVVPSWLFNIISQQHSVTEDPDSLNAVVPMPLVEPIPLAEPVFDINGNTEDLGIGSGAGDGRGMHSDHSQDSSGRGTSLSSSETSSGQQSEAIIIDASAFLGRFEPIGEHGTLAVPIFSNEATQPPGNAVGVTEEHVAASTRSSRGDDPRIRLSLAASDVDADVSSLNTDATDSSDN